MADKVSSIMDLLEAGADPLIRNNEGKLPIDLAKSKEAIRALEEAMALRRWQMRSQ
jgi:ankyrin repeat protein